MNSGLPEPPGNHTETANTCLNSSVAQASIEVNGRQSEYLWDRNKIWHSFSPGNGSQSGSPDKRIPEINQIGPILQHLNRIYFTQGAHLIWIAGDRAVGSVEFSFRSCCWATVYLKIKPLTLHNTWPLKHIYTCAWQRSDCSGLWLFVDAVWAGAARRRSWNGFSYVPLCWRWI